MNPEGSQRSLADAEAHKHQITRCKFPTALHIAATRDPLAIYDTIRFSDDATFWRDRAATLADFEIGGGVLTGGANPHGTEVRMGDPAAHAVGKKRA